MIEILVPAIPADVCKFVSLLRSRILKYATYPRQNDEKNEKKTNEREFTYISLMQNRPSRNEMGTVVSAKRKKEKKRNFVELRIFHNIIDACYISIYAWERERLIYINNFQVTITGFDLSSYRQSLIKWNHAISIMYGQCKEIGSDKCLMVPYEQLVLHPRQWMKKILNFLDVPWNESVMHHEEFINKPGGVPLSK